MYISLLTITIVAAIVIFCWFRKPARKIADEVAETVEIGADILHGGLSQLRDQVEVAAITSSVRNTLEVLNVLQENKDLIEKGVTVHSLYCGYQATKADITIGEKGRPLTDIQRKALLKAQFMSVLNDLAPQKTEPEAQPTVQATQPTQADADAEVFRI